MKFSPSHLAALATPLGGEFAVASTADAYAFCRSLSRTHYENFPVGSLLIPQQVQPHFFSVYAFSRIADDIADEPGLDTTTRLALLDQFEALLNTDSLPMPGNPVFAALHQTRIHCNIPTEPFVRLLNAFRQDIHFQQPSTWHDVHAYCSGSANPVGELVLRIFGLYTDTTGTYSDDICTALQLANFWQDISVDRKRGRIYIPEYILQKHNIAANDLLQERISGNLPDKFAPVVQELVEYTEPLFSRGESLLRYLSSSRLRLEIAITIEGGREILRATAATERNILLRRPIVHKRQYAAIFLRALMRLFRAGAVQ